MLNKLSLSPRRSHRRLLYPLMSLMVASGVFVGTPQQGEAVPLFDLILRGVQVVQLSNVSANQEIQLGRQINQQLVSSEVRLSTNRALNSYVNQIGQRLAKNSDRPDIPYTFQVVADNSINAFATMGGFVYINTGTIVAADNEAQLASVIAHEIGHISGRHAIKQMRQGAIAQGVSTAAGLDTNRAVQIGVELALRRPKSRQDEYDSDKTGLRTLTRAGYAPSAMVGFMEKLLSAGSGPTFLSSHPGTSDRIAALKRAIDPATANVGAGLDSVAYKNTIRTFAR
jgi:predicted Zn-dependent protease